MKENYELLNYVNEFYNSAWEKLIIIGSVAFAIIGIVVPLIIQWYQKKTLLISEKHLKEQFKDDIKEVKEELREEIRKILAEEILKFELKIQKLQDSSNAKLFHLQGQQRATSNKFDDALWNYTKAAHLYLKSDEYGNLTVILEMIEALLDKVTKSQIEDLKITQDCDVQDVMKIINDGDEKSAFDRILVRINLKLKKLE